MVPLRRIHVSATIGAVTLRHSCRSIAPDHLRTQQLYGRNPFRSALTPCGPFPLPAHLHFGGTEKDDTETSFGDDVPRPQFIHREYTSRRAFAESADELRLRSSETRLRS